jgi:hypothetical protein
MKPVLKLFGNTLAHEFGPLAFKTVRQQLIDARKILLECGRSIHFPDHGAKIP